MTIEFWIFLGTWLASIGVLIGAGNLRRWRVARQLDQRCRHVEF